MVSAILMTVDLMVAKTVATVLKLATAVLVVTLANMVR